MIPAETIKLAGAAWSWVGATFAESAAIYRALGVSALDFLAVPGSRFDTYQVAADPAGEACKLKSLGGELSNLLMFFGNDFRDRAVNDPDGAVRDANLETFRRVLDFCATAGFHSVTVLPGVEQPNHSRGESLAWTAIELNRLNDAAKEAGILLVYEPHVQSILESPQDTLAFAQANSDVKLIIDYSHCVSLGYTSDDLAPLVPFAGHVHLRQAAPGKIQARWEEGAIDFPALVGLLKRTGYQGYLTLEYEHDKFWNMDLCDVMTETIKMRDAVLPCIS